jgi:hypothetical protein
MAGKMGCHILRLQFNITSSSDNPQEVHADVFVACVALHG